MIDFMTAPPHKIRCLVGVELVTPGWFVRSPLLQAYSFQALQKQQHKIWHPESI